MEIEVRYKDPTGKIHTSIVGSGVDILTPRWINNAIFRAGKDLIFTTRCPYNGTQIHAESFRLRATTIKYKQDGDWYWEKQQAQSKWSRWYSYSDFYDESFPEIEVVRTVVKVKQSTRHA